MIQARREKPAQHHHDKADEDQNKCRRNRADRRGRQGRFSGALCVKETGLLGDERGGQIDQIRHAFADIGGLGGRGIGWFGNRLAEIDGVGAITVENLQSIGFKCGSYRQFGRIFGDCLKSGM